MVAALLIALVPLIFFATCSVRNLQELSTKETRMDWTAPDGVSLKVGPETFAYDGQSNQLTAMGPVTRSQQEELRGLLEFAAPEDPAAAVPANRRQAIQAEYEQAVDLLSFKSRASGTQILLWLLLVGGVFGASGSLARLYTNFLRVACYSKSQRFDLPKWWPYYVLLPILGFIQGVFVTILLKANLLSIENQSPAGNLWWAGVAILVGFGSLEVSERLKALGSGLFGTRK